VEAALKSFEGEGEQTPPAYSAVKYKGKRLYKYAREGVELPEGAVKSRRIMVSEIKLLRYTASRFADAEFEITSAGGLYVRTICHDAGERLGCGAAMSALRRLKSGPYAIGDSVTVDALEDMMARGGVDALPLLPTDSAASALPKMTLSQGDAWRFANGRRIKADSGSGIIAVYRERVSGDAFIGVGMLENGILIPRKILI
jgi:tRNA pseudouridine55 synthase